MKQKRVLAIVLCIIMALTAVSMVGCKGKSGKTKDGMVIGVSQFIDTLNPLTAEWITSAEVFSLIYDPLIRFDENLKPTPCLAESWETSEDGLTWTFKLVDTKWHDGKPFTSEDVKWTYDTMLTTELGYLYSSYLEGITSIECPDERTAVIKTEQPKANMLQVMTPIMPKHIWEEIGESELETYKNDKPVGTGPFSFVEKKDTSVTLTKNGDYFGKKAQINNLTFVEYKNSDSIAQALKTGEIDAATSINADQTKPLLKESNLEVISGEVKGFTQLGINVVDDAKSKGNPLLKDKNIRQAIEFAIDKKKAAEMLYDNAGEIGSTLINPSDPYHYEPAASELRSYSIEKANALLDKAGYTKKDKDGIRQSKDGKPLKFSLITIADNTHEVKYAQMIKAGCKEAGIEIDCVTMDRGALGDKIIAFDYDMFIWGWGADVDPTVILSILTTDEIGGSNEPGWSNKAYDALVKKQTVTMDEKERLRLVQEAQKILYDEAPYIILIYDNFTQAYRTDRWTGMKPIPANGTFFFNLTDINYVNVKAK